MYISQYIPAPSETNITVHGNIKFCLPFIATRKTKTGNNWFTCTQLLYSLYVIQDTMEMMVEMFHASSTRYFTTTVSIPSGSYRGRDSTSKVGGGGGGGGGCS